MRSYWRLKIGLGILVLFSLGFGSKAVKTFVKNHDIIEMDQIRNQLAQHFSKNQYPDETEFEIGGQKIKSYIFYNWDQSLQAEIQSLFDHYNPNYGSFVAIDPETGNILAMVSHIRGKQGKIDDNLALKATFPAASVFKVITAAAALSKGVLEPDSTIPVQGSYHTLFKKNVYYERNNRWTKHVSLRKAFALSINSAFGKIGAFMLGPEQLRQVAEKFLFNQKILSELPVEVAKAPIPDDTWGIVEAASGFTRENTLSPLQGALIASAIVNNGTLMQPRLIKEIKDKQGQVLYRASSEVLDYVLEPEVASQMKNLMRATVTEGTSKRSFKGFFSGELSNVDVGGKTGSLTGFNPKGKYDWFIGYGEHKGKKIAFSSLAINVTDWTVKSAFIARKALEHYFSNPSDQPVVVNKK